MSRWNNRTVLVSGGSSGLGLHLATAWHRQGAKIVIVGRNHERLESAASTIDSNKNRIQTYGADAGDQRQVDGLFQWLNENYPSLDVVVNAVGRSARGAAVDTDAEEFESLIRHNFLTTVRMSKAAIPALRKTRGSLINIGSLAAKIAGNYLGGYPAAKFAVAAYSAQLRRELESDGVHVLLVCPGPLQREDGGHRYDDQTGDLPAAAREPAAGAKLSLIEPNRLAKQIMDACSRRQAELVVPGKARWLAAISQISPRWGDWVLKKFSS